MKEPLPEKASFDAFWRAAANNIKTTNCNLKKKPADDSESDG